MRFVARRLGFFLVTLWAAVTLNFLIPRLMPGNAAIAMMSRYKGRLNPQADTLIEQYAGTSNPATQHQIVKQLEAIMVNDIPVIPVTEGVDWYQYNTKDLTGWVVKGNPYARPAAYVNPDWGVMLLHLKAKQG